MTPERRGFAPAVQDLSATIRELRRSDAWRAGKRSARTLLKEEGLRVTLAALPRGATVSPHRAEGPITVQVLEGRIRFRTDAGEEVLEPGGWLALPPSVSHAVEALEDAAFLVTVGLCEASTRSIDPNGPRPRG